MYKENKGYKYEEIAKKHLLRNDYMIVEENFNSKFGEIDIIAIKDDTLCFIEVKGRKNAEFCLPREAVTKYKKQKIMFAAKYFLLKEDYDDIQCRFDVIEVLMDERQINHIENAFEAS